MHTLAGNMNPQRLPSVASSSLSFGEEQRSEVRGRRRQRGICSRCGGNIKEPFLLRDEAEVLEGRAQGGRVDVLLPGVFIKSLSAEG